MSPDDKRFGLLLVDDEPQMRRLLVETFAGENYRLHTAAGGRQALDLLVREKVDAALIDLVMPEMDGLSLLQELRRQHPAVMVIMLTGHGGIEEAVRAVKLGAVDFLEKPFSADGLRARVAQLCRIWELQAENRRLRQRLQHRFRFQELVGSSTAMLRVKELITRVGPTDATVLIQGETGTGKELVARAIHAHSRRAAENFVPVDCAAISETVIESELFGHVKGAFTGAHTTALGLVRSADKGTLFLDEVGELSPGIQVKLLRTIQEREVRPVGSSKSYPVDVRILAATNRDLARDVGQGRFREDLYYRLNVMVIHVPPLRDRDADIALLVRHFLKRLAAGGAPACELTPEALACFENYHWPGNVRELENVIRRAVALGHGDAIRPEDLPENLSASPGPGKTTGSPFLPSDDTLAAYEEAAISNALAKSNNHRGRAARLLGIGEATLYRKIKKYGIGR